jgi:ABC-type nitrate/sulfonate/bicarbonate transport system substrate-binding protein
MNRIAAAATVVIIAIMAVGFGVWHLQSFQRGYAEKPESITIGVFPDLIDTPIYVADEQGMFRANGLNVTVKNYETGLAASDAMLNGKVDLAMMSEFVAAERSLQNENITIIANCDKSQRFYLIGRKNRGIENVSNLLGRKIGITKGTITEFYLGRFLELHGINSEDVTQIDVKPSDEVDALCTGNVDAFIGSQSEVDKINQRQAGALVLWPAQSGQLTYNLVACRKDWAAEHAGSIKQVLQSLGQADDYITDHPAEAWAIVQERLNYNESYIAEIWQDHQFSLSLNQSLVTAMEDEGRWMNDNNITNEKAIPDFGNYIYTKGLEEIKPNAVNIW